MRHVIVSIVLVLFVCTGASAESSVWKAQKDGAVIYLGGTFHVLRESDYPLPAEFDTAYKASGVVVFETDLGALQSPSAQRKLLAKALYADGSTIDKHLSARVYDELSAYCEANGIPLTALNRFKPSMLMTTLTVMELTKLGVTRRGVDQFFHELAGRDGKRVEALETADVQIDYLVSMADGNEDEFVTHSIRDMGTVRQQFEALADAWRTGDAGRLNELLVAEFKTGQPKLYGKLIIDRNRNWLPLIEAYRKAPRTAFILVGAAHLVGPDGILEALKEKGYRVEKL